MAVVLVEERPRIQSRQPVSFSRLRDVNRWRDMTSERPALRETTGSRSIYSKRLTAGREWQYRHLSADQAGNPTEPAMLD